MLSILTLETLSSEYPNASEILELGYQRRELPIKRLTTLCDIQSFIKEAGEGSKYNVVLMSLKKVQEAHVSLIKRLRVEWPLMFVVFVLADVTDVQEVAQPSIQASSIIYSPLKPARLYRAIKELYEEYMRLSQTQSPKFVVKNGAEQAFIPTANIYFFEARAKKIALKTVAQEITFYTNFEAILEQLPNEFIRCHKGFVVNTQYIQAVNSGKNMTLSLADGSVIPVSRTYRQAVMEALLV